ncbi:hypothetical protein AVEN_8834-1 [Araneus ventricosus]|uniref:Uncharacterized protein n=1 Tax=Araneus ventricosus TaxID=182803 RepID=A0A4Y2E6W8_ARAVE|nr:hypothetical protein AVEN_8834-1 [Araneus ventricosus]
MKIESIELNGIFILTYFTYRVLQDEANTSAINPIIFRERQVTQLVHRRRRNSIFDLVIGRVSELTPNSVVGANAKRSHSPLWNYSEKPPHSLAFT